MDPKTRTEIIAVLEAQGREDLAEAVKPKGWTTGTATDLLVALMNAKVLDDDLAKSLTKVVLRAADANRHIDEAAMDAVLERYSKTLERVRRTFKKYSGTSKLPSRPKV